MDDDLTLEKMKIHERLGIVETKVDNIEKKVDRIHDVIIGNGHPGLCVRVDRIEQCNEQRRNRMSRLEVATITAIFAIAVQYIMDFFKK